MTSKATQTVASATPSKAPAIDSKALLQRIADLTAETLAHPQVINKTDQGVASRVARFLNKEATFACAAHRFWTGSHVLAYVAKNS